MSIIDPINQKEVRKLVLQILFLRFDQGFGPSDIGSIQKTVRSITRSHASNERCNIAVSDLIELGFIDLANGDTEKVEITGSGVRFVEENFSFLRRTALSYDFFLRKKLLLWPDDLQSESSSHKSFAWDKWAAIATALGLPVGVILWLLS